MKRNGYVKPNPNPKGLRCPECGSVKLVKNGFNIGRRRPLQRWLCKNCYRNTVKPREARK